MNKSQNESQIDYSDYTKVTSKVTQTPKKVTQTDGIMSHSQIETKSQNVGSLSNKEQNVVSDTNNYDKNIGSLSNKEQIVVSDTNICDNVISRGITINEIRDSYYEGISNLFDSPSDWGKMEVKDANKMKSNGVNSIDKSVVKKIKDKSGDKNKIKDVNVDKKILMTGQKTTLKDWIVTIPRTKVSTSVEAKEKLDKDTHELVDYENCDIDRMGDTDNVNVVKNIVVDKNLDNFVRSVSQSTDNSSNLRDREVQTGLQNSDTIGQSGRRIVKSRKDKTEKLYDGQNQMKYDNENTTSFDSKQAKDGAENEFLAFFEKFKGRKKESDVENDRILERNRKAKCFSEIEILGSKSKNVLKLKTFFETNGKDVQRKKENITPKERGKRRTGKNLLPLVGQRPIDMFFKKENSGQQTPNSGKRKLETDSTNFNFNFASANTPKKKNLRLEGSCTHSTGV